MLTQQRECAEAVRLLESLLQPAPPPTDGQAPAARGRGQPQPAVLRYIDQCERVLRSPRGLGAPALAELERRGIPGPVVRANRVGYDPGPATLPRPRGLPRQGAAIVLPVFDASGRPVTFQARYLAPGDGVGKYACPSERLAGPSPRVGFPRLPGRPRSAGVVLVCEGLLDALSATAAGYRAAAVLGAGLPGATVAAALVERFPRERLAVAFDADAAGQRGAGVLREALEDAGAGGRLSAIVPRHGDLNGWLQREPRFLEQLDRALGRRPPPPAAGPGLTS